MELKDLVGEKLFSGIDFDSEKIKTYGDKFEDCQCVNFVLDDKTYTAIEDPDDGYRSSMKEIKENIVEVKNKFNPIRVLAKMKENNNYCKYEVLQLLSISNGNIIFEVGTENTNDYYPMWLARFYPENIEA